MKSTVTLWLFDSYSEFIILLSSYKGLLKHRLTHTIGRFVNHVRPTRNEAKDNQNANSSNNCPDKSGHPPAL